MSDIDIGTKSSKFGFLLIATLMFFGCDDAQNDNLRARNPYSTVEWNLAEDIEYFSSQGVSPIATADLITALDTDNYIKFEKSLSGIGTNYSSWLIYYEVNINRGLFNFYFYAFDENEDCIIEIDKLNEFKTDIKGCPDLTRITEKKFDKDIVVGRDNPVYGFAAFKSGFKMQEIVVNFKVPPFGERHKDMTEQIINLF